MTGKDLLSIKDLTRSEIEALLEEARLLKATPLPPVLEGKVLASCFFEPSTRTRLSFEAAMHRLGGRVMGFAEGGSTSAQKGESLADTMKILGMYADVLVIRHPQEGAAKLAAQVTDTPVINAGDGTNEHPTQTLLDLFSLLECQGRVEGLHIALAGDLLHGRTVHSLAYALRAFGCRLYLVSPPTLTMPEEVLSALRHQGILFSFHSSLEEVIARVDVLYMTRTQKERFTDPQEYIKTKDHLVLSPHLLKRARPHLKIFHPLPRREEIPPEIDVSPYAYYFTQAQNGLYMRQALLLWALGKGVWG